MKILKAFLVYISTFAILSVIPLVLFGWFTSWTDDRKDDFCAISSFASVLSMISYLVFSDHKGDFYDF